MLSLLVLFFLKPVMAQDCNSFSYNEFGFVSAISEVNEEIERENWAVPYASVCDKSNVKKEDASKNKFAFIDELTSTLVDEIQYKIKKYSAIIQCFEGTNIKTDTKCANVNDKVVEIKKIAAKARNQLLLAQDPEDTSVGNTRVNRSVNLDSFYKAEDWYPLTNDEIRTAYEGMKDIVSEATKQVDQLISQKPDLKEKRDKLIKDTIYVVRLNSFQEYATTMLSEPVLQFIKSPQPTNSEIKESYKQVIEKLKQELAWVQSKKDTRRQDPADLLAYNSFVSSILMKKPEYCSAATGLAWKNRKMQTYKDVAGYALMGASFVLPLIPGLVLMGGQVVYGVYQGSEEKSRGVARSIVTESKRDIDSALGGQAEIKSELISIPVTATLILATRNPVKILQISTSIAKKVKSTLSRDREK